MSKAVDAMALWEAHLALCSDQERPEYEEKAYQKIEKLRELQGTCELRETYYELAGFINTSWSRLCLEDQYTITEYHQLDAWDWEYLPYVLVKCAVLKRLDEITVNDLNNINDKLLMLANQAKAA